MCAAILSKDLFKDIEKDIDTVVDSVQGKVFYDYNGVPRNFPYEKISSKMFISFVLSGIPSVEEMVLKMLERKYGFQRYDDSEDYIDITPSAVYMINYKPSKKETYLSDFLCRIKLILWREPRGSEKSKNFKDILSESCLLSDYALPVAVKKKGKNVVLTMSSTLTSDFDFTKVEKYFKQTYGDTGNGLIRYPLSGEFWLHDIAVLDSEFSSTRFRGVISDILQNWYAAAISVDSDIISKKKVKGYLLSCGFTPAEIQRCNVAINIVQRPSVEEVINQQFEDIEGKPYWYSDFGHAYKIHGMDSGIKVELIFTMPKAIYDSHSK